jgi:hypothetical protein
MRGLLHRLAGAAAAAVALGAALWGDPRSGFYQPALAATYRQAAEQIYAYGKARPVAQSDPFGFYPDATWQDDLALAAAELYRATGNPAYLLDARRLGAGLGHLARFDSPIRGGAGARRPKSLARAPLQRLSIRRTPWINIGE